MDHHHSRGGHITPTIRMTTPRTSSTMTPTFNFGYDSIHHTTPHTKHLPPLDLSFANINGHTRSSRSLLAGETQSAHTTAREHFTDPYVASYPGIMVDPYTHTPFTSVLNFDQHAASVNLTSPRSVQACAHLGLLPELLLAKPLTSFEDKLLSDPTMAAAATLLTPMSDCADSAASPSRTRSPSPSRSSTYTPDTAERVPSRSPSPTRPPNAHARKHRGALRRKMEAIRQLARVQFEHFETRRQRDVNAVRKERARIIREHQHKQLLREQRAEREAAEREKEGTRRAGESGTVTPLTSTRNSTRPLLSPNGHVAHTPSHGSHTPSHTPGHTPSHGGYGHTPGQSGTGTGMGAGGRANARALSPIRERGEGERAHTHTVARGASTRSHARPSIDPLSAGNRGMDTGAGPSARELSGLASMEDRVRRWRQQEQHRQQQTLQHQRDKLARLVRAEIAKCQQQQATRESLLAEVKREEDECVRLWDAVHAERDAHRDELRRVIAADKAAREEEERAVQREEAEERARAWSEGRPFEGQRPGTGTDSVRGSRVSSAAMSARAAERAAREQFGWVIEEGEEGEGEEEENGKEELGEGGGVYARGEGVEGASDEDEDGERWEEGDFPVMPSPPPLLPVLPVPPPLRPLSARPHAQITTRADARGDGAAGGGMGADGGQGTGMGVEVAAAATDGDQVAADTTPTSEEESVKDVVAAGGDGIAEGSGDGADPGKARKGIGAAQPEQQGAAETAGPDTADALTPRPHAPHRRAPSAPAASPDAPRRSAPAAPSALQRERAYAAMYGYPVPEMGPEEDVDDPVPASLDAEEDWEARERQEVECADEEVSMGVTGRRGSEYGVSSRGDDDNFDDFDGYDGDADGDYGDYGEHMRERRASQVVLDVDEVEMEHERAEQARLVREREELGQWEEEYVEGEGQEVEVESKSRGGSRGRSAVEREENDGDVLFGFLRQAMATDKAAGAGPLLAVLNTVQRARAQLLLQLQATQKHNRAEMARVTQAFAAEKQQRDLELRRRRLAWEEERREWVVAQRRERQRERAQEKARVREVRLQQVRATQAALAVSKQEEMEARLGHAQVCQSLKARETALGVRARRLQHMLKEGHMRAVREAEQEQREQWLERQRQKEEEARRKAEAVVEAKQQTVAERNKERKLREEQCRIEKEKRDWEKRESARAAEAKLVAAAQRAQEQLQKREMKVRQRRLQQLLTAQDRQEHNERMRRITQYKADQARAKREADDMRLEAAAAQRAAWSKEREMLHRQGQQLMAQAHDKIAKLIAMDPKYVASLEPSSAETLALMVLPPMKNLSSTQK